MVLFLVMPVQKRETENERVSRQTTTPQQHHTDHMKEHGSILIDLVIPILLFDALKVFSKIKKRYY